MSAEDLLEAVLPEPALVTIGLLPDAVRRHGESVAHLDRSVREEAVGPFRKHAERQSGEAQPREGTVVAAAEKREA